MSLKLYDTYTRTLREFIALQPPNVGLYTCGPTVYDYAHLGNLRTYIFEDTLRRTLEHHGYAVKHVMNITDVGHLTSDADTGDDKMEVGSKRTGKSAREIAETYTKAFKSDLGTLNILEPTVWCKATDHIQEQIAFIECIEANGYTYQTSDGIYFDTSQLENYGYLARLDIKGLKFGARVDTAEKRNPTDFALWKFSLPDTQRQMEWNSPWGIGFPGWHIECSTMAVLYLGKYFDIHCGGEDHIPVHHPNEIAQVQACHNTNLANYWLHGYFLQLDDGRMSKSSGDFLRLQTVIDKGYDPLAYRFYCLSAHYRSKLNFSWEGMDGAANGLNRLRINYYEWGEAGSLDEAFLKEFLSHINDDLNMPRATAVAWQLVKSELPSSTKKATLCEFDKILGLGLENWEPLKEDIPQRVLSLVQQRQQARREKRWRDADALRKQIATAGYEVQDTSEGPRLQARKQT